MDKWRRRSDHSQRYFSAFAGVEEDVDATGGGNMKAGREGSAEAQRVRSGAFGAEVLIVAVSVITAACRSTAEK